MATNTITDEMFDRISHEFLYDCSREALIEFLSAKGYDTNNLTDEAISFLLVNRLPLYVFARENGLHNKPVTKFSPDEEKLPHRDSCKEHPYFDRNGYGRVVYDGKSNSTFSIGIVKGLSNIKGLNSDNVARSKMYFSLKGCNDDTYFYIYEYEYDMYWSISPSHGREEKLPVAKYIHTYCCIELKEVHIDEVIDGYDGFKGEECYEKNDSVHKEDKFVYYYDERLNRYRFFNKTENFVSWQK